VRPAFPVQAWMPSLESRRRALAVLGAIALGTASLLAAPGPTSAEVCADPFAFQVTIYVGGNFDTGQDCNVLGIGDYANAAATGIPDNSMSSIKVGSGVMAITFWNNDYGGASFTYVSGNHPTFNSGFGGLGDNDTVSSMIVEAKPGEPVKYLAESVYYDKNWAAEVQGLAIGPAGPVHSVFITNTYPSAMLWRIDTGSWDGSSINSCASPPTGFDCTFMPASISGTFNHFGDPDVTEDGEHVLVPLEGATSEKAVAVFDADTLDFEGWDDLFAQNSASWVSVHDGQLWSSDQNIQSTVGNNLVSYSMDWSKLCLGGPTSSACYFLPIRTFHALHRFNGTNPDLRVMQGGDFDESTGTLYLSNGDPQCAGGDGDGVRAFDVSSGKAVAVSVGFNGGDFRIPIACGFDAYEESEGLDVLDSDSVLHFFLLDNDSGNADDVFWKVFRAW
jgi:hypothetical protein